MNRSLNLLSFFLIATLATTHADCAWSKTPQKKYPRKATAIKSKPKAATAPIQPTTAAAIVGAPAVAAAASLATPPAPAGIEPPPANIKAAPARADTLAPVRDMAPPPAYQPRPNPYLAGRVAPPPVDPVRNVDQIFSNLRYALPSLPLEGQAILPVIKTVYPTGEKPLVVVTFKCPTELVGVTPPPTKVLHDVVNAGMDLINNTNLLAFNMQQVCQ